mgnify:CR=1 FL=1
MSVQAVSEWYLFFDSIYIGEGEKPAWALLCLRSQATSPTVYAKDRENVIDYPGEYELSGYHIFAFSDPSNDLLSYAISFRNQNIAYIQCKKILDDERMTDMDTWYITSSDLQDQIEKREFEGDIELLE